jgi:hypothetical protein
MTTGSGGWQLEGTSAELYQRRLSGASSITSRI